MLNQKRWQRIILLIVLAYEGLGALTGYRLARHIATAVVFGYGGWLYMHGQVEIGTLVAFVGYLTNFFDPVQQLSKVYNTFLAASAALEKIFGVLDAEPDIVDRLPQ